MIERVKMRKEILINVESQEKRVAILEGKRLEEFYVERKENEQLVGNIYKGRVDSIVPGIGAAFVDVGLEKRGFLYVSDIINPAVDYAEMVDTVSSHYGEEQPRRKVSRDTPTIEHLLKKGQDVLVQVVKEPIGTKGVRLTTHITLPGRYLVLMPYDAHLGISKRIEDEVERKRLKDLLKQLNVPSQMGFIVRTAGRGSQKREIARDVKYLLKLWQGIKSQAEKEPTPSLIHTEFNLVLRVLRDSFTEDIDRLLVDSKDEYRKIAHFLNNLLPHMRSRLELYRNDVPLFEAAEIEKEIEKIYSPRIFLKKGGHISIELTEGMVAIDVNSGRFSGKKTIEETAYYVNLEAAAEIARQVRLRDIGGIIVIDFIDMDSPQHRREVFRRLEEGLEKDRAKTNILPFSEIGVVELTRQRMRSSLESVSYDVCPYCQGRGKVKSPVTVAIFALRGTKKYFKETNKKKALIVVHPKVASCLLNEDRGSISKLENIFKSKIMVKADPNLHIEEVKIEGER